MRKQTRKQTGFAVAEDNFGKTDLNKTNQIKKIKLPSGGRLQYKQQGSSYKIIAPSAVTICRWTVLLDKSNNVGLHLRPTPYFVMFFKFSLSQSSSCLRLLCVKQNQAEVTGGSQMYSLPEAAWRARATAS